MYLLSSSSLGLFRECPRCFYLRIKEKIHRPTGPMSSLPQGMDGLIKKYFDKYRAQNKMPPGIKDIEEKLFLDQELLKKWRNWRTGLKYEDKNLDAYLVGALDDCLVDDDEKFVPLDYKTRGYEVKEYTHTYYQHQMDIYTFLLDENGYKTKDIGYLLFFHPISIEENSIVKFELTTKKLDTDRERAKKLFEDAAKLLQGPTPQHHSDCEYCSWAEHQHEVF